jgi:hypothetical protein
MAAKSKRERFEKVAGTRVQMVLEKLDNLSNCANKRNYEFNNQDIEKMFKAITEKLKMVKMKFESELESKGKGKSIFKF